MILGVLYWLFRLDNLSFYFFLDLDCLLYIYILIIFYYIGLLYLVFLLWVMDGYSFNIVLVNVVFIVLIILKMNLFNVLIFLNV